MDLAWRRRHQVGAAHDGGDALRRIVDDDRELIGDEAVGAPDHEVADVPREVLLLRTLQQVAEADRHRIDADAHRACAPDARRDRGAAGARIDALAGGAGRQRLEVASRACAGKGGAGGGELRERVVVERGALRIDARPARRIAKP